MILDTLTLAYLDPGTGSMLLPAIVGGGAGLVVLFCHFGARFGTGDPGFEIAYCPKLAQFVQLPA